LFSFSAANYVWENLTLARTPQHTQSPAGCHSCAALANGRASKWSLRAQEEEAEKARENWPSVSMVDIWWWRHLATKYPLLLSTHFAATSQVSNQIAANHCPPPSEPKKLSRTAQVSLGLSVAAVNLQWAANCERLLSLGFRCKNGEKFSMHCSTRFESNEI